MKTNSAKELPCQGLAPIVGLKKRLALFFFFFVFSLFPSLQSVGQTSDSSAASPTSASACEPEMPNENLYGSGPAAELVYFLKTYILGVHGPGSLPGAQAQNIGVLTQELIVRLQAPAPEIARPANLADAQAFNGLLENLWRQLPQALQDKMNDLLNLPAGAHDPINGGPGGPAPANIASLNPQNSGLPTDRQTCEEKTRSGCSVCRELKSAPADLLSCDECVNCQLESPAPSICPSCQDICSRKDGPEVCKQCRERRCPDGAASAPTNDAKSCSECARRCIRDNQTCECFSNCKQGIRNPNDAIVPQIGYCSRQKRACTAGDNFCAFCNAVAATENPPQPGTDQAAACPADFSRNLSSTRVDEMTRCVDKYGAKACTSCFSDWFPPTGESAQGKTREGGENNSGWFSNFFG